MKSQLPGLQWEVTKENWERTKIATSSACVHADAIKQRYPEYSRVKVNVATIQVTDSERGVRLLYLTPSSVADLLIAFDQGWRVENQLPKQFRIRNPVKRIPIVRSASDIKLKTERRVARLTELEAKEQSGELTSDDKRALVQLKNAKEPPVRPTTYGKAKAIGDDVVQGGPHIKARSINYDKYHANILHERNRHFGAKSAQPSKVFKDAVEEAVEEALKADRAERRKKH